jgi:anti-sigma regulatory factor (Ser/Thr protein kinase)
MTADQFELAVPAEYRLRMPAGDRAPSIARRLARVLDGEVPPETMECLELLVTELVTNSVRHSGLGGGGWVELEIACAADRLRVEVTDPGRGFDPDAIGTPSANQGSGWGLFLVGQMAERWGVHHDAMTRVWFELAIPQRLPVG